MTTLTEALKSHTHATHDALDHLVMSHQPFASKDNYKKFLQAQYAFHQCTQPIYQNPKLSQHIDELQTLCRIERIKKDMADLAVTPFNTHTPSPSYNDDEAVGWLYCVEGSNVGAAMLYKHAGKINLDKDHGASHLSAHADGVMPHWRSVKAKIDALPLTDTQKQSALKGADDAFAYYTKLIDEIYG